MTVGVYIYIYERMNESVHQQASNTAKRTDPNVDGYGKFVMLFDRPLEVRTMWLYPFCFPKRSNLHHPEKEECFLSSFKHDNSLRMLNLTI